MFNGDHHLVVQPWCDCPRLRRMHRGKVHRVGRGSPFHQGPGAQHPWIRAVFCGGKEPWLVGQVVGGDWETIGKP